MTVGEVDDNASASGPLAVQRAALDQLLEALWLRRGSDLLLTAGASPLLRIDGALERTPDWAPLTPADTEAMLMTLLSARQAADFAVRNEVDLSFSWRDQARFRANGFRQRGSVAVALRLIPYRVPGLDELGVPPVVQEFTQLTQGLVLVTGPTGSGKTTTLYSLLTHLNNETINIMTLEDPVEYPVTMMRQTSVNETVKMDFGNGIRSIMRQDPDVILVGEVRDKDTAEMAFRAAMTGHQVFTTLHTNSALGTFPRLLDIGISTEIMAGNIIGVIAQRLVRVLCSHCKETYAPAAEELQLLGQTDHPSPVYRAVGCKLCHHKGYRGRIALMELLFIDSDLDELIARHATLRELREAALGKGFKTLAEDGIRRVLEGRTSVAEVSRVVDLTGRLR